MKHPFVSSPNLPADMSESTQEASHDSVPAKEKEATGPEPSTIVPITEGPLQGGQSEIILVDFDDESDPSNPQNWSPALKWSLISMVSAMDFVV